MWSLAFFGGYILLHSENKRHCGGFSAVSYLRPDHDMEDIQQGVTGKKGYQGFLIHLVEDTTGVAVRHCEVLALSEGGGEWAYDW